MVCCNQIAVIIGERLRPLESSCHRDHPLSHRGRRSGSEAALASVKVIICCCLKSFYVVCTIVVIHNFYFDNEFIQLQLRHHLHYDDVDL